MKPKFQPEFYPDPHTSGELDTDLSEQLFSASLAVGASRFTVDSDEEEQALAFSNLTGAELIERAVAQAPVEDTPIGNEFARSETVTAPSPSEVSWQHEVAKRVQRYRSKRRSREPRYPSLLLKFESQDLPRAHFEVETASLNTVPSAGPATEIARPESAGHGCADSCPLPSQAPTPFDSTAKILAFPAPVVTADALDELADAVSVLRILDVPEVKPLPPALGGILIDPQELKPLERRPGFEMPLQSVPISRRLLAATVDAFMLLVSLLLFAYVSYKVAHVIPSLTDFLIYGGALSYFLWASYQFAFLVYAGTTPGLRVAKLELKRFNGAAASRTFRRRRALASLLSSLSVGLGYAWCGLDEDRLCWHDRITGTYLAPSCKPAQCPNND